MDQDTTHEASRRKVRPSPINDPTRPTHRREARVGRKSCSKLPTGTDAQSVIAPSQLVFGVPVRTGGRRRVLH